METKSTFAGITLTNGLIGAAILFVLNVLYYVLNINYFSIGFGILSFIVTFTIIIVMMVIAMKNHRDKVQGGVTNYGHKLLAGIVVSLLAILLSGFLNFVFFELVDPDYMNNQMEDFLYSMEDRGMTEEQLEMMHDQMAGNKTPLQQWIQGLKYLPIVAVVLSLIVAAFVKSDTTTDNIAV
ncbi:MAG: DUF4199 domain-containing protein [Bacteroidales bacterium]